MWRDERLHRNVSTLDAKENVKVLRELKPKKSLVGNEMTYGFIPQDVEKHSKDLVNKKQSFLELSTPINAQTMTFLVKLDAPCQGLFEKRRVIFTDCGEFKIKEVIDEQNFTVDLEERTLPPMVQLTHVEVYDMKSFDKDIVTTMTVSALQEIDKEVQTLKGSILDDSRLKTLNVRISLLENIVASITKRLESLENL
jgi:hypothetical protein